MSTVLVTFPTVLAGMKMVYGLIHFC